ncbi:transposable element Tcb2 transposase [Trichonephila clavipes]|nr:transposable element Tcb2 transposase [Trichonephila clavipes]
MEWPACSPDMNPIDHVWNALGRRVAGRQPPPQTSKTWKELFWDRIPQLVINSLIDSMPQSRGSLVVMVTNKFPDLEVSEQVSGSLMTLKTRRVKALMHVKPVVAQYLHIGMVQELGELSLGFFSKIGGPLPALVLL